MISEGHPINEGFLLLWLMQTIGGANGLEGTGPAEPACLRACARVCVMIVAGDGGDEF